MVRFRTSLRDVRLIHRAATKGIGLENIASCRIEEKGSGEFLLRFGCLDEATIRECMRRLASMMEPL